MHTLADLYKSQNQSRHGRNDRVVTGRERAARTRLDLFAARAEFACGQRLGQAGILRGRPKNSAEQQDRCCLDSDWEQQAAGPTGGRQWPVTGQ